MDKLKVLLTSISCLCAEGPEFMQKLELTDAIQKLTLEAIDYIDAIDTQEKSDKFFQMEMGWIE